MKVSEVYEGAEVVCGDDCRICSSVDSDYTPFTSVLSRFLVGLVIFLLCLTFVAYIMFNLVLMHTSWVIHG